MARRRKASRVQLQRSATVHERAGRIEEALECWLAILEDEPERADTHNRVGDLYDKLGRGAKAAARWTACAELYRQEGFFPKAVAVLRKAVRRDPKDVALFGRIADLHVAMGHVSEAKRLYVEVGEKWLQQGRLAPAIEALETVTGLDDDPGVRRMLARLCEQAGDKARAVLHLLALAQAEVGAGRPSEAREALEQARALAPSSRPVRDALADVYSRLHAWDQALALLEGLSSKGPADARPLLRLAEAYAGAGRWAEARDSFRRWLERQPEDDDARVRMGLLRLHEDDPDGAFEELAPLVERFVERGHGRRAAGVLEEIAGRFERHVRTLLKLGTIYHALGDREALARTYDRVVAAHRERGDADLELAAQRIRDALAATPAAPPTEPSPLPRPDPSFAVERAAEAIRSANALLIAAGAGMNVDYGWPDYRSREAFQTVFPAYRGLGFGFEDLARPGRFEMDPALAWGFYAARLEAARRRVPHPGFVTLARWRSLAPGGGFVATSCVEGEFQRGGFDAERLVECVGSIEWFQCARECGATPWPATPVAFDADSLRAREPFPACARCSGLARPNVMLFGDWAWDLTRITAQDEKLRAWTARARGLVVVECGETPRLPALRHYVRRVAQDAGAVVVRISGFDATVPEGGISVPLSPVEALELVDRQIRTAA